MENETMKIDFTYNLQRDIEVDEPSTTLSEFATIKFAIAQIQFGGLSLSTDKQYIEANQATHAIAHWVLNYTKEMKEQNSQLQQQVLEQKERIEEVELLLLDCEVLAFQDDLPDYITKWQEYLQKVSDYRLKHITQ